MAEMIYKTFRVEVREVDEENGIIDMLIPLSTGSVDRDGEVIEPTAFKKSLPAFRKRPILLSSHDYRDLRKQIGQFVSIKVTDEGLIGKPKYYINEGNEEADWAFKLATKNMAAYSVGFIPKVWKDGDDDKSPRRTYEEAELLEVSHIVVPSNRDAIQGIRAKSLDNPVVCELCDEVLADKDLVTKPEETDDWIRIPVSECKVTATIDISKKEGIKALYCGKEKEVRTYLFDKREPFNWTMAKAKKWVEDHKEGKEGINAVSDDVGIIEETPNGTATVDKLPTRREYSQAEIIDELDYLLKLIESEGMNEEVKEDAWNLVREVMRLTGGDIPDDIEGKVGAVLNQKNRDKLGQIQSLAQQILDSAEKPEPKEDDKKEPKLDEAQIKELVMKTVTDVIEKAQGKVN